MLTSLLLVASTAFAAPKIAIVIDDFGLDYKTTPPDEEWLALDFPVTFAVMPESPRTRKIAQLAHERGREVIIHFPFEPFQKLALPKDRLDPEDLAKTEKLLEKAFAQIPQAVGLNNHQSYYATMNRPFMAAVMPKIKPRVRYFLDSAVSKKTVAHEEARKAGIPAALNYVFMEDKGHWNDRAFAARMLRRAADKARRDGSAIVIGHHYYRGTLEAVRELGPKLKQEGFELVYASALAAPAADVATRQR